MQVIGIQLISEEMYEKPKSDHRLGCFRVVLGLPFPKHGSRNPATLFLENLHTPDHFDSPLHHHRVSIGVLYAQSNQEKADSPKSRTITEAFMWLVLSGAMEKCAKNQ